MRIIPQYIRIKSLFNVVLVILKVFTQLLALEGLGAHIINSLRTAILCGNKLFSHMELQKAGLKTPKAISAFSDVSAMVALDRLGYPAVIKPTVGSWGRLIALLRDKDASQGDN